MKLLNEYLRETFGCKVYKIALDADEYEAERNVTILQFMKCIFTLSGMKVPDFTAANNKIASNFFHRLTIQRVSYSLGNGISFPGARVEIKDNKPTATDTDVEAEMKKILYLDMSKLKGAELPEEPLTKEETEASEY